MTTSIFTLADARDEKRNADLPALAAAEAAHAEATRVANILHTYPEIGVLGHGAGRVYYAYTNGYDAAPFLAVDPAVLAKRLDRRRAAGKPL
jgi:hypothetical protein